MEYTFQTSIKDYFEENDEFENYLAGCTFDSNEKESFIIRQGSEEGLEKLKVKG